MYVSVCILMVWRDKTSSYLVWRQRFYPLPKRTQNWAGTKNIKKWKDTRQTTGWGAEVSVCEIVCVTYEAEVYGRIFSNLAQKWIFNTRAHVSLPSQVLKNEKGYRHILFALCHIFILSGLFSFFFSWLTFYAGEDVFIGIWNRGNNTVLLSLQTSHVVEIWWGKCSALTYSTSPSYAYLT